MIIVRKNKELEILSVVICGSYFLVGTWVFLFQPV